MIATWPVFCVASCVVKLCALKAVCAVCMEVCVSEASRRALHLKGDVTAVPSVRAATVVRMFWGLLARSMQQQQKGRLALCMHRYCGGFGYA